MYTYFFKCEAISFINTLAMNEGFKSRCIRYTCMRKVIDQLSDPYCELVVNHDLTEVKDGICWSQEKCAFIKHTINEGQIRNVSPRFF